MSRIIRVDDEMYEWLKQHAIPFGDTPNRVIRRLLGLDPAPGDQGVQLPWAQRVVLGALRVDADSTAAEVATATGIGYSTTTQALAELERAGLARRRRPVGVRGRASHQWRRVDQDAASRPAGL